MSRDKATPISCTVFMLSRSFKLNPVIDARPPLIGLRALCTLILLGSYQVDIVHFSIILMGP